MFYLEMRQDLKIVLIVVGGNGFTLDSAVLSASAQEPTPLPLWRLICFCSQNSSISMKILPG